jgi:endonuclease/exonuclease/phosphatase family metal-dependent hydrolase
LASYNIRYGLGADDTYDLGRVAAEIESADVIALQEVDRFWARSGNVDGPEILSSRLPDHHWVFGPNLDIDASHRVDGRLISRRKQFGTMVLSRWPIVSTRNFPLPKWGDRRHHSMQQGMLEAVVAIPSGPIRFYSAHLSHLGSFTRLPQVERCLEIIAAAPSEGGAWCGGHPDPDAGWLEEDEPPMPDEAVLMGDLNFGPDSAEYDLMIGGTAPRIGRLTSRKGLVDAWTEAGNDEAAGATHPKAGVRIDHCLVTADLASRVERAWIDTDAVGSDHWPLWVELAD